LEETAGVYMDALLATDFFTSEVVDVVLDKLAHGSSPEDIHVQYPHLSLAQIRAALAYDDDRQHACDAAIERLLQEIEPADICP
jgi:hypothetical protein